MGSLLRPVFRIIDAAGRLQTAWDALRYVLYTALAPAVLTAVAWWKGAAFWQRVVVFDATWVLFILIVWFGVSVLYRFGSTADVEFRINPGMEAALLVTNRGPSATFFASLWFQGEGTGGHPPLFAHWGDATEHRIRLARGQTGVITLGRLQAEAGGLIRRWDLFGVTHFNVLQHVQPLSHYRVGDPVRQQPHATVTVQLFADPDLERPPKEVIVAFADDTASSHNE